MIYIKKLEEKEYEFLMDMRYEAIYILENKPPKEELMNIPDIKKYSDEWGRKGDRALIASNESSQPVGAAWYRLFSDHDKGFGYAGPNIPEIGIAVLEQERNKGIGKLLLDKLLLQAIEDGFTSVSLSVDPNNISALTVYKKIGFEYHSVFGTSWTMILNLSKLNRNDG
ncbi:GNAT family N-acetyltransferase [Chengkuizengella axinellae]|uniref:GNAT family N-acetyltransferase n=1 Tax=Chengkuizengella axinellae TaxID=3064388 RepID=A0ABT9J5X3_9BACL|nr:GNAT family N-acetyltransferase [Chengkuizengella sp. 2205SS18-9]MDP5277017.1 GNAT family N-acetyltransferase [Chengkuizengella sp. 2205SS18-9]